MLTNLLLKIAAAKQSTRFLFDYIHALIAYGVVFTLYYRLHVALWIAVLLMSGVAVAIEWVFDQRYEHSLLRDNLRDTLDYAVGIVLAIAVVKL